MSIRGTTRHPLAFAFRVGSFSRSKHLERLLKPTQRVSMFNAVEQGVVAIAGLTTSPLPAFPRRIDFIGAYIRSLLLPRAVFLCLGEGVSRTNPSSFHWIKCLLSSTSLTLLLGSCQDEVGRPASPTANVCLAPSLAAPPSFYCLAVV